MATQTPNYHLTKPAGVEDAQISVINANIDILDAELHLTTVRDAQNLAPIYDQTEGYDEGDFVTYYVSNQQGANGYYVFKANTDIAQPAGAFDSTKWDAVCITDEMGSGGGGGGEGGHIFLDNEGTAMPQRAKAKFEGAYSTDNSTDGITNVAVFRTMSGVEFEQLSDAEKQGMIYVDDETTGTDDKFQPVIYSLEEREIGVWTDGKPLYQKTIDVSSNPIELTSNNWIDTPLSSAGIENIIDVKASTNDGSTISWLGANRSNTYVRLQSVRNTSITITNFTIQYTKTTDTAGSGQWTPQGVPAVHYSTDEKVVGTWIDGKILYQKTWTGTISNSNVDIDVSSLNIDSIMFDNSHSFKIQTSSNNVVTLGFFVSTDDRYQAYYRASDNVIRIMQVGTTYAGTFVLTAQYTKAS